MLVGPSPSPSGPLKSRRSTPLTTGVTRPSTYGKETTSAEAGSFHARGTSPPPPRPGDGAAPYPVTPAPKMLLCDETGCAPLGQLSALEPVAVSALVVVSGAVAVGG